MSCAIAAGRCPVKIRVGVLRCALDTIDVDQAAVEKGALVLVAEDFVGERNFLEGVFGLFVSGVQVRVVFLGELAKGASDVLFARIGLDAQYVIRICSHRLLHILDRATWRSEAATAFRSSRPRFGDRQRRCKNGENGFQYVTQHRL